jgi:hypothetical protein
MSKDLLKFPTSQKSQKTKSLKRTTQTKQDIIYIRTIFETDLNKFLKVNLKKFREISPQKKQAGERFSRGKLHRLYGMTNPI